MKNFGDKNFSDILNANLNFASLERNKIDGFRGLIKSNRPTFDDYPEYIESDLGNIEMDEKLSAVMFPESAKTEIENFLMTVESAMVIYEKTDGFLFVANKKDIDKYTKEYKQNHNNSESSLICFPIPKFIIEQFNLTHQDIDSVASEISLRDKINFAYLLFAGDFLNKAEQENQNGFNDIIKRVAVEKLHEITLLKTELEKTEKIVHFMHTFPLSPDFWNNKIDVFNKTVGTLKTSEKYRMDVVLSDCSYTDFFGLKKDKFYIVMHSIKAPKIKQFIDFSNLFVNGNFTCDHAKAKVILPREINGFLNYSYCKYPIKSVPKGTNVVNLAYTVKSIDELNAIQIPDSVQWIGLSRSLINKAASDENESRAYQTFAVNHPKIELWDEKHSLSLNDAQKKQQEKTAEKERQRIANPVETVAQKTTKTKEPKILEKTSDWMTRKEVMEIFAKDERFIDVDKLDRVFKCAVRVNNVTTEIRLANGQQILCVHIDSIENLTNAMLQHIQTNQTRADKKINNQQPTSGETVRVQMPQKTSKPKTRKIKKYIPLNIWKKICNACNDSVQMECSVLENILKVNVDFTNQQRCGPVQYINVNGQIQTVPTIIKKNGSALVQRFEKSDSRRIVWTMDKDKKFIVATEFFDVHQGTKKIADIYDAICAFASKGQNANGTPMTRELLEQCEYVEVSDLLKQIQSKNTRKEETRRTEQKQDKTAQQPAVEHDITNVENTSEQLVVRQKRPRIKQSATLVDLKALETQTKAMIKKLDMRLKQLSRELPLNSNDPEFQLKILNQMKSLIEQKIQITKER